LSPSQLPGWGKMGQETAMPNGKGMKKRATKNDCRRKNDIEEEDRLEER
jgi:hypothetical protein